MTGFSRTLAQLQSIWLEDQHALPSIFWHTIDHLNNDELFVWVERLLQIRNAVQGQDYLRVTGIQHQYRLRNSWSIKQKRSIAIDLIKHWDQVELRQELA